MVSVDALLAMAVTVAVTPVGADIVVVPAEVVYQVILPLVPEDTFEVVTAYVAAPADPAANCSLPRYFPIPSRASFI